MDTFKHIVITHGQLRRTGTGIIYFTTGAGNAVSLPQSITRKIHFPDGVDEIPICSMVLHVGTKADDVTQPETCTALIKYEKTRDIYKECSNCLDGYLCEKEVKSIDPVNGAVAYGKCADIREKHPISCPNFSKSWWLNKISKKWK